MSIYSQFISKFTTDANSYILGEIVSYPSVINGPSTLDSNNFIKTGQSYTSTSHSSLNTLIGKINAFDFKSNTVFLGGTTGLTLSSTEVYTIVGNKVYRAWQSNEWQEISTLSSSITSIGLGGTHRLRYNYEKSLFLLAGPGVGEVSTSTDAVTWNTISSGLTGFNNHFYGFDYGNGVYIALAQNPNNIRTSSDLNYWGQFPNIRANNSSTIRSSVYANNKYVLVGDSGVVKTSPNGLFWTDQTSGTASILRSIVFGNQLYVYAGDGGVLASSTDAVTWTARTSATTNNITTLAYSNSVFIYGTSNGSIGRSTNGTSWTFYPGVVTNTIYSSAAIPGLYVVGADAGKVATSTNGITWTSRANVTINLAVGSAEYTTPGTFSWTAPTGVTSVSVVCVGGGGGFYRQNFASGSIAGYFLDYAGGGGGLGWKNNISVTPGSSYTVNVGRGGIGFEDASVISSSNTFYFAGSNSWFDLPTVVMGGGAGLDINGVSRSQYGYLGGKFAGDGGADGGDGPTLLNYYYYDNNLTWRRVNGGGAGGYGRQQLYTTGGQGLNQYQANNNYENFKTTFPQEPYYPRKGGGGSSGAFNGAGGGVGIWGCGINGNSWIGIEGSDPHFRSRFSRSEKLFGYGGSSQDSFSPLQFNFSSGNGAVRIVWGPERQYSNTPNVYLIGNIASGSVETDDFYSMTYANGIFLGGSANGRIFTSTDAITWSLSYASGNNLIYLANTINTIGYINHGYVYGDSTGQLGFTGNTSNVWYGVDGFTGGNTILTIATNGNDYVYAGSNGWIGKVDNGFTGLPKIISPSQNISYFDFLYENVNRQFIFVGDYGSFFISENNTVNNFRLPTMNVFSDSTVVNTEKLPYFKDSSYEFYTVSKISGNNFSGLVNKVFVGGRGPFSNAYVILLSSSGSNSNINEPFNLTSNNRFFYSDNTNYIGDYGSIPVTCISQRSGDDDIYAFYVGTSQDVLVDRLYSYTTNSPGSVTSLGTNFNISSPNFISRSNNGVYLVLASTSVYTSNGNNSREFSNLYDVTTQFNIPQINIAPVTLSTSQLIISNDHFTIANTLFENVYIKAK